jgi:hypothetical protein
MANATQGYPYLLQLVGYHSWRQSDAPVISDSDVSKGISIAQSRIETSVLEYAINDLSMLDRDFLMAMLDDAGVSRIREIAQRLEISSSQANVYRARLIEGGLIAPAGHGQIKFALPYLHEYLNTFKD